MDSPLPILYEFSDELIIAFPNGKSVIINRLSEDIKLSDSNKDLFGSKLSFTICAIWGLIRLPSGMCLIVITDRQFVGRILTHEIYRVKSTRIIPFASSINYLSNEKQRDEKIFIDMLNYSLGIQSYYYSDTYDITHTLQRMRDTSVEFPSMSLIERADERFVWNRHAATPFLLQEVLKPYCVPVMMGYIGITASFIKQERFEYILISRRSVRRAGLRLHMRGANESGETANYVETEQIVLLSNKFFSFVQIRGSIPIRWHQRPNLLYKPRPVVLGSLEQQLSTLRAHLDTEMYLCRNGRIVMVNLINQSGSEQPLGQAFSRVARQINYDDVRYEEFDFHRECKNMQWHRLRILTDRLKQDLEEMGYFHAVVDEAGRHASPLLPLLTASTTTLMRRQVGVFRANCIDSLDRTNVVQSLLAFDCLELQLRQCQALFPGESLEQCLRNPSAPHRGLANSDDFYWHFKALWTENADQLSRQYTGTPALKTDFTRTGRRTVWGALADGYHSAVRYLLNNFYDGFHQDGLTLLLGNFQYEANQSSPFTELHVRDWKLRHLPTVLYVALAMFALSFVMPLNTRTEQMMYLLFWGTASFSSLFAIFYYGNTFVDNPRIITPELEIVE